MPRDGLPEEPSTSHRNNSSSPMKRRKMEIFEGDPIPFDLEVDDLYKKRKTLVFPLPSINNIV